MESSLRLGRRWCEDLFLPSFVLADLPSRLRREVSFMPAISFRRFDFPSLFIRFEGSGCFG